VHTGFENYFPVLIRISLNELILSRFDSSFKFSILLFLRSIHERLEASPLKYVSPVN